MRAVRSHVTFANVPSRPVRSPRLMLLMCIVALGLAFAPEAGAEQAASSTRTFQAARIDAGSLHTCAVQSDGTLRCWGEGAEGRLGYASTGDVGDNETPANAGGSVNVGPGRTVTSIAAGSSHTCALLDDGTVRCWGFGNSGRLGYANTQSVGDNETPGSVGPVSLGSGREAVAITAGAAHTCALLDNGTVRCWGFGGSGRLGTGSTNSVGDNETPGSVPAVDLGGHEAIAVSAGGSHTCALLDDGTVRCWGFGGSGRLGYGNISDIGNDEPGGSGGSVDLGLGRRALAISAADAHTCALLDNGTVRCWGEGDSGRLGLGNANDVGDNETPGSVATVALGTGRQAVAISAGASHTCALLDNGSVSCWGEGDFGRLGYGNATDIGDNETPAAAGPVNLGGHEATAIAAGGSHTCATLDDGTRRCWGEGDFGRLGYGNPTDIGDNETPASVGAVSLGTLLGRNAIGIAVGDFHSCALIDDGTVRCWGPEAGVFGELGYGTTLGVGHPSAGGAIDLGAGRSAVAITAGGFHTCALLDNGTVRCWGDGRSGQLGYGNTSKIGDDEAPGSVAPVTLQAEAVAVTAGASHTCALLDIGTIRCWGEGDNGRLGYGHVNDVGDNETPAAVAPVSAGGSAVQISASRVHTCARLATGAVRCWGAGSGGRLGYGNVNDVGDNETPASVSAVSLGTGRTATGVSADESPHLRDARQRHPALLGTRRSRPARHRQHRPHRRRRDAGVDRCGQPRKRQERGDADRRRSSHSCATLTNGGLECWGENEFGQTATPHFPDFADREPGSTGFPDGFAADVHNLDAEVLAVDAAHQHTCILQDSGRVRCWGRFDDGLGYPDYGKTSATTSSASSHLRTTSSTIRLGQSTTRGRSARTPAARSTSSTTTPMSTTGRWWSSRRRLPRTARRPSLRTAATSAISRTPTTADPTRSRTG